MLAKARAGLPQHQGVDHIELDERTARETHDAQRWKISTMPMGRPRCVHDHQGLELALAHQLFGFAQ